MVETVAGFFEAMDRVKSDHVAGYSVSLKSHGILVALNVIEPARQTRNHVRYPFGNAAWNRVPV